MKDWIIKLLGGFTKVEVEKANAESFRNGKVSELDRLATELFERGGYGTLQLAEAGDTVPRMRFVDPTDVKNISSFKASSGIVFRNK